MSSSPDSSNVWHKVCAVDSLAENALQAMEVGGIPVLVVNGQSRRLVIPRSCPHMANPLADGAFDGHVLTCTKHLWQWSVDAGGTPVGMAESPLLCYETKEEGGDLYCRASHELRYQHEDDDDY